MGHYELPDVGTGTLGPLEEQQVLLASKPSFQLQCIANLKNETFMT